MATNLEITNAQEARRQVLPKKFTMKPAAFKRLLKAVQWVDQMPNEIAKVIGDAAHENIGDHAHEIFDHYVYESIPEDEEGDALWYPACFSARGDRLFVAMAHSIDPDVKEIKIEIAASLDWRKK